MLDCSMFDVPKGSWKESPEKFLNPRKTSNTQHPTSNNQWFPIGPLIAGWVLDVGCSMFPRGHGKNSPKNSRIEPLNRRKTSNTQHPTSNNQWFPIGPLIAGWVLDVGCSQGVIGRIGPA